MKTVVSFTLLIFAFYSCDKDVDCVQTDFAVNEIAHSSLYGAGDEGIIESNMVITSQDDWNELLDKLDSVNDESSQFNTTTIDFSQQIVIASFDKVQSNGGYGLSLENAEQIGDQIHVDVVKTDASAGGGMVTTVITQPYHIIAINACGLDVVFN